MLYPAQIRQRGYPVRASVMHWLFVNNWVVYHFIKGRKITIERFLASVSRAAVHYLPRWHPLGIGMRRP
jgi:hypothetical protein